MNTFSVNIHNHFYKSYYMICDQGIGLVTLDGLFEYLYYWNSQHVIGTYLNTELTANKEELND